MADHLQAARYHVHKDHWLTSKIHQLQHNKVHLLILNLPHTVNKYPISKIRLVSSSLHSHKLIFRMLHHCNLLHQHPSHFSSLLSHSSNTSHSYSHQCQSCMLHTSSRVSHTLYNPGLAPKANPSRNQDNHHHSDNILTLLHSLHLSYRGTTKSSAQHTGA